MGNIVALCDGADRLESKALGKNSRDRNGNGVFLTSIGLHYWNNSIYNRKSDLLRFNELKG